MRDTFGAIFADHEFAALFPTRGQPAEAPWRLAMVTIMPYPTVGPPMPSAAASIGSMPSAWNSLILVLIVLYSVSFARA
jgi:hypothetical protein